MMLYAHVPFCPVRCQFCEYTVVDPKVGALDDSQEAYFKALRREIEMYSAVLGGTKSKRVVGFDIGGGTPSMARSSEIASVIDLIDSLYTLDTSGMEISIETTPRIAAMDLQKLKD
jgi:oxygen-independent coproporphyrinogen-3 oxidase